MAKIAIIRYAEDEYDRDEVEDICYIRFYGKEITNFKKSERFLMTNRNV